MRSSKLRPSGVSCEKNFSLTIRLAIVWDARVSFVFSESKGRPALERWALRRQRTEAATRGKSLRSGASVESPHEGEPAWALTFDGGGLTAGALTGAHGRTTAQ